MTALEDLSGDQLQALVSADKDQLLQWLHDHIVLVTSYACACREMGPVAAVLPQYREVAVKATQVALLSVISLGKESDDG